MIYSYDGTFFGYLSAVIDRDEALLRKDQAQPAVRADIFDLGQAVVPGVEDGRQIAKKSSIITVNHRYRS